MKKTLIVMLLMLMGGLNVLFAQSKGEKMVGAIVGVDVQKGYIKEGDVKTEGKPIIYMEASPAFYFFPVNKFRIGAQLTFWKKIEKYDHYDWSLALFEVAPSVSYYIKLAEKFHFTPEITAGFIRTKRVDVDFQNPDFYVKKTTTVRSHGFSFHAIPVKFEFRPAQHLCISASVLNFSLHKYINTAMDSEEGDICFDFGMAPRVGIGFYF